MNDDNSNRLTEINTYYTKIGIIVAIICAGVTIACTIISLRLDITWLLWVAGGLLILIVLFIKDERDGNKYNNAVMSYSQIAQMELFNALRGINSEADLNEFKDLVALVKND